MLSREDGRRTRKFQFITVSKTGPSDLILLHFETILVFLIVKEPRIARKPGPWTPNLSALLGSHRSHARMRSAGKVFDAMSIPHAMARPLEGRVALVTGSTGDGMGRSTALTLAREGADVVLNCGTNRHTRRVRNRRLLEAVESFGVRALLIEAKTQDGPEVRAMFAQAKRTLGPVDILVNNAGGRWDPQEDLTKVLDRFWQTVLRAEIDGIFHTIKAALPDMRRHRWGRIVNLGMERSEEFGEPPYDYTVGKIARHGLTRILSEVEIPNGVTINAVAPGYVPSFTFEQAIDAVHHAKTWTRRTHGTPQDVAELVAWLCSEEARFVKGAIIPIHGAPW
jgi:NAD(P)-dependent dehydrogenase (short-subunit alcohol dehydrogenase family)